MQNNSKTYLPSYEECVAICSAGKDLFYETKHNVDGFLISIFNYRFATYKDFVNPIQNNTAANAFEMRGLTFVFNEDGSLFKRFLLLEKFFNMNQAPESLYSVVKNYGIKAVNNKEDGSIASYVSLPNGKVVGRSMGSFDNMQTEGLNRIYSVREDVKNFVDWCLANDITAIFEYVAPNNRIVVRYWEEDLILLRMRDNKTGNHFDVRDYKHKIGSIKVANFIEDYVDLDNLIDSVHKMVDAEGVIVQTIDDNGNDLFFKLKSPWYLERHGLLTNDLYREHILIGNVLDNRIDDLIAQIPEEQVEARERIENIAKIVFDCIKQYVCDINKSFQNFLDCGSSKKEYALKFKKTDGHFGIVCRMVNGEDVYEPAKEKIRKETLRLMDARAFLAKKDNTFVFNEPDENKND
jgi:T4 RnlA family RNA ligase